MSKVLVRFGTNPILTTLPQGVTATTQEDGQVLFECVSFVGRDGVLKINGTESVEFTVAHIAFPLDKIYQFVTVEV